MSAPPAPRRWLTVNAASWIITNGLGALAFLHFASKTWIEPELRGEDVARDGDAVVWFATALPFALACLVADVVMIVLAIRLGLRRRVWSPLVVALCIGLGWALAMAVDVSRRY